MKPSTALALAAAAIAAWTLRPMSLKERAEAVLTADANGGDAGAAYRRLSLDEMTPAAAKRLDTRALQVAFEAVYVGAQRDPGDAPTRAMDALMTEAVSRGFLGGMDRKLFDRALDVRDLGLAKRLAKDFPWLAPRLPRVSVPEGADGVPAVLRVSDGGSLRWEKADLSGPRIVAVVAPGCRFSRRALEALGAEPALRRTAAARGLFVDGGSLGDAAEIARAGREGWVRYDLLYKPAGWPVADFGETPQFYFLKDGTVVRLLKGYKPETFLADFRAGAREIGL